MSAPRKSGIPAVAWAGLALAALLAAPGARDARGQALDTTLWCANGPVEVLVREGGTLYAGGSFYAVGPDAGSMATSRWGLAAFDLASGAATGWNPTANGPVHALVVVNGIVYAGGDFTTVGGLERAHLAAIDAATGEVTGWNPGASGPVQALLLHGGTLFVGGDFDTLGGQPRGGLGAVDPSTGALASWDAHLSGASGLPPAVFALAAGDGVLFAGGSFDSAGSAPRPLVAALHPATGAAKPWYGEPADLYESGVISLAWSNGVLYAGGLFGSLGGQPRACVAALDASSGVATAWDPRADWVVTMVATAGNTVLVGGDFDRIGGKWQSHLAGIDPETGQAAPWDLRLYGEALCVATNDTTLYVGGYFRQILDRPRTYLAAVTGLDLGVTPGPAPAASLQLHPTAPNPARTSTALRFTLPAAGPVSLAVYDAQGRRVARPLDHAPRAAGYQAVLLDVSGWHAGVYFCRVEAAGTHASGRLVVAP